MATGAVPTKNSISKRERAKYRDLGRLRFAGDIVVASSVTRGVLYGRYVQAYWGSGTGCRSSGVSFVAMMQAANQWNLNHVSG